MAGHHRHQRVEVSDDGRTVAPAEVIISGGSGRTARTSLRGESGHLIPGRRASLVDAVLDLPEVRESARLKAVFRSAIASHCTGFSSAVRRHYRPAGSSAILEADLPSGGDGSAAQEPAGEADSE